MFWSNVMAEVSRSLASCRSRIVDNNKNLMAALRGSPTVFAMLLVVSAAMFDREPPPDLSVVRSPAETAAIDLDRDGWVTLFKLGHEMIETMPEPLASPLLIASQEDEAGPAGNWLEAVGDAYLPSAQVTIVDPSMISVESGGTASSAMLAGRLETLAVPESRFAAALQRAAARGYRERFANRVGRLSQSLAMLAQRAEVLADKERAAKGITAKQTTVAEQIRQNSESMPTTLHLSALLVSNDSGVATTQQAAAPRAARPSS